MIEAKSKKWANLLAEMLTISNKIKHTMLSFLMRQQEAKKRTASYVSVLRTMADFCNFGEVNDSFISNYYMKLI